MPDNTVITILGRKGSGKSYLSGQILTEFPRAVILDSMGEYPGDSAEGLEASVRLLMAVREKPSFTIAARILETENAERFMRLVYEIPGVLFVVEETSLYCSPSYLPTDLARLIRYGRHREISLLFIARRPSELHRDVTAQSDLVISFRQHEPIDVKYLRSIFGPVADRAATLPQYRFLVMGDRSKAPLVVLEGEYQGGRQITLDNAAEEATE